jgi:hypothetical protein
MASTRFTNFEGRRTAIVPVVMIVEGVLPGSSGPLMYPRDELAQSVPFWNGKPVLSYHAELWNSPVSASEPEVWEKQRIGWIFNTKMVGNKLAAEAWVDRDRCMVIDNRIWQAIIHSQKMEVSTGLLTENDAQSGQFNGVPFEAIARNYQPDHLACLPDARAACSISDGCGLNVRNSHRTRWRRHAPKQRVRYVGVATKCG